MHRIAGSQDGNQDGGHLIRFFMLELSLFLASRCSIECASDALVDSDRPPTISGSLKTDDLESLQEQS
jgi:hypothetical protein